MKWKKAARLVARSWVEPLRPSWVVALAIASTASTLGGLPGCSHPSSAVRSKQHVDYSNSREEGDPAGVTEPQPALERDRPPSRSSGAGAFGGETPEVSRFAARRPERLASQGQADAVIMVPSRLASSGQSRLRVVFAAHGAGGRGVDHCEYWDQQLADDVLIVCPTGTLLRKSDESGGAYFKSHLALRTELDALALALRDRFQERIVEGKWLYLGYSQGATMGALALLEGEEKLVGSRGFSQLVLVEGGGENWNVSRSRAFKDSGGESVALVCGTPGCGRHGRGNIPHLEAAGLTATLIEVEGGGHAYWGPMTGGVHAALAKAGYAR